MVAARDAAAALPYGPAAARSGEPGAVDPGIAAWSLVHGLATLLLNGNLPPGLGADPGALTRRVAGYLSAPGAGPAGAATRR